MSYSPVLGRFIQRDPAGYVDGTDIYEYEQSQTPDSLDPSGLAAAGGGYVPWFGGGGSYTPWSGGGSSYIPWGGGSGAYVPWGTPSPTAATVPTHVLPYSDIAEFGSPYGIFSGWGAAWANAQRNHLRDVLTTMCQLPTADSPDCPKGGCTLSECAAQADEIAFRIVNVVLSERIGGHSPIIGGTTGNIIRKIGLGFRTGRGLFGINNCGNWQSAINQALLPYLKDHPFGSRCFTLLSADWNTGMQHHWIQIRKGNVVINIDPWGSGGSQIIDSSNIGAPPGATNPVQVTPL